MTFCVSGGRGDLHGVRGDELAPHRGRANHGLKTVEKILANYNNWLASTGPAFGRGNCFYDGGHSTRVNAWKITIKTVNNGLNKKTKIVIHWQIKNMLQSFKDQF